MMDHSCQCHNLNIIITNYIYLELKYADIIAFSCEDNIMRSTYKSNFGSLTDHMADGVPR